jgi:hypothetical protein
MFTKVKDHTSNNVRTNKERNGTAWLQAGMWKVNGKVRPKTGHKDPVGEKVYSSTLSLNSVLNGGGGDRHAQAALPPGSDPIPNVQEAGWTPRPFWKGVEKPNCYVQVEEN